MRLLHFSSRRDRDAYVSKLELGAHIAGVKKLITLLVHVAILGNALSLVWLVSWGGTQIVLENLIMMANGAYLVLYVATPESATARGVIVDALRNLRTDPLPIFYICAMLVVGMLSIVNVWRNDLNLVHRIVVVNQLNALVLLMVGVLEVVRRG